MTGRPEPVGRAGSAGPRARVWPALLFGLVAGAALGSTEVAVRLAQASDPALAGRTGALLTYAVLWYGLAGALLFGTAACVARLGLERGWHSAREGTQPIMAGSLVALGLPIVVVFRAGHLFRGHSDTTRLMLFFMLLIAAGLTGWCVARAEALRPGIPSARFIRFLWRPRLTLALAAGLLFASGQRVLEQPVSHAGPSTETQQKKDQPGLVLLLVDELVPEDLGCYGGSLATPHIDALARGGALFERALDRPLWTLPWLVTLLSRLEPLAYLAAPLRARASTCENLWPLDASLHGVGYQTVEAALDAPFVERLWISQLVTRGVEIARPGSGALWLPALRRDASGFPFVRRRSSDALLDLEFRAEESAWPVAGSPHFFAVRFPAPSTAGSDTLPHIDAAIGRLLAALRADGLLENSYVVLTSDPSRLLRTSSSAAPARAAPFPSLTHVPLLLAGPGIVPGTRVELPVDLADLASTLRVACGAEQPLAAIGTNLFARCAERD